MANTSKTPSPPADLIPITEVERQTGIRQATLRMWEKRYGFPCPERDRYGDRVYPRHQVERLQQVRFLMDQGMRPGRIFSEGTCLEAATIQAALPAPADIAAEYTPLFKLLREYRSAELHTAFQYRLMELGLRRFLIEFIAPLTTAVGLAWRQGALPIGCEHLYTQLVISTLHAKQATIRASGRAPRVVLSTLPGERHALGILMAEATLTALEAQCIQLGTETPPLELASLAQETAADIVALSFSSYFPRNSLLREVGALRARLPAETALWIGGAGAAGVAGLPSGVDLFNGLAAIEPALARWHAARSLPPVAHGRPP